MTEIALLAVTLLLAYSNGANDNFKGVATLYGSGVLNYRQARLLSTLATVAGAIATVALAEALLKAFSGRGLVPNAVVSDPAFAASAALGAGLTVALATRIGMPISTTHALVGALVGAGALAAGSALNLGSLTQQFLAPLLLGPVVAFVIAALLAALQRKFWATPTADEACACVSDAEPAFASGAAAANTNSNSMTIATMPSLTVGTTAGDCAPLVNSGAALVVTESRAINAAHVVSAASVCFARGLNDAPKIAALLLVAKSLDASLSITGVALAMALGGWLHSRRIAETMSHKIVKLEPRSSFLANVCTAGLVISASKYGLPLSTTHVSVGAISGLSIGGEKISSATLKQILLSWVATLPCAALTGAIAYSLFSRLLH
jgi:inorganic phosphate transporter, PiT family